MKLKVFCVYDSKISMFMQPFFFQHTGQAIRAWETSVNDPQSNFWKYPADFTLFEVGSFEESTGEFDNLASKINLGTALEHKRPTQENDSTPFVQNIGKGKAV